MKKKFGIIGNPIKHSLSPTLHNYWFKKYKIDASYSIIEANENNLKTIINRVREKELSGLNVTLPYKQKIISYLDTLINDAEITSSVNTLYINNEGTLIGENTDVYGLQAAYLKKIDIASQKKVLIIGAGGVSPSVILSLQKSGVKDISIINRTREKCIFLKKKFKEINILEWKNLKNEIKNFEIIINATSLGLNKESINLDFSKFANNKLFYDVIYNPEETNFLKEGKKLGNKTENGKLMFIYQAFEAFKLWHGIEPQINSDTLEILNND